MTHKMELIAFFHEAADLRVRTLSEQASRQPDFVKISNALADCIRTATSEDVRLALLEFEALKNAHVALLLPHIYRAGARDSLILHGLLLKTIYPNQ